MGDLALPFVMPRISDPGLETVKFVNFLQSLEDRRRRALKVSAHPIDLTIDFTTTCQLSCPYCAVGNGTMQRPSSLMGEDLYRQIVSELSETTFVTWYFSTGEPLLHKRLTDLLDLEKGQEVFSSISTNLSLPLSDDRIDALLICGLKQISVSLDGASPETYAQYRIGGNFEMVFTNLVRLINRKKELGLAYPLIEWRFLLFEHNGHEIDLATRLAEQAGVDLLEFFPGSAPDDGAVRPFRGAPPASPVLGPAFDRGRLNAQTSLQKALAGSSPWPVTSLDLSMQPHKCDWHYLGGMIYPDGAVGSCCVSVDARDDFGKMTADSSYASTYNNERFYAARRSFVTGAASGTICDQCPTPAAQHLQFTQKLRAILRIAPDWVLTLLEADFERFLFPSDARLMPGEVAAIASGQMSMVRSLEPLAEWCRSSSAQRSPVLIAQAQRWLDALDRPATAAFA